VTFIYSTESKLALGPTQPPIQWIQECLSLGENQTRRESDHSPPSSSEIKSGGAVPPLPPMCL
jgi:hypothetical protein